MMKRFLMLAALCAASGAYASDPLVPAPEGAPLIARLSAKGVQVYACQSNGWTLTGPDATLFDGTGKPVGTHFAGPTWKNEDGSSVVGDVAAKAAAPEAGAVPWLLLKAKGHGGNGAWTNVAFIRRSETRGGVPPSGSCDVGQTLREPYEAVYELFAGVKS